jgi:hypothetical protein
MQPRRYFELADKRLRQSIRYVIALLFVCFIITTIISIPKVLMLQKDFNNAFLGISEYQIQSSFSTQKPVSFPTTNALITIDTTKNSSISNEILFIEKDRLLYNILGNKEEFLFNEYKLSDNRQASKSIILLTILLLLPGIMLSYYIIYLIKYFLIIIVTALIAAGIAKITKNIISLKKAFILAAYTSTIMIGIETLLIPFALKKTLLSTIFFPGIHISWPALTLFLALFVTAIRLNGSTNIKDPDIK